MWAKGETRDARPLASPSEAFFEVSPLKDLGHRFRAATSEISPSPAKLKAREEPFSSREGPFSSREELFCSREEPFRSPEEPFTSRIVLGSSRRPRIGVECLQNEGLTTEAEAGGEGMAKGRSIYRRGTEVTKERP